MIDCCTGRRGSGALDSMGQFETPASGTVWRNNGLLVLEYPARLHRTVPAFSEARGTMVPWVSSTSPSETVDVTAHGGHHWERT